MLEVVANQVRETAPPKLEKPPCGWKPCLRGPTFEGVILRDRVIEWPAASVLRSPIVARLSGAEFGWTEDCRRVRVAHPQDDDARS